MVVCRCPGPNNRPLLEWSLSLERGWLELHASGTYVRRLGGGDHTIALRATS